MERRMARAAKKRPISAATREGAVARHGVPARFSIASLMDERGAVNVDEVAETFAMSKAQLAETAGLAREVIQKASRRRGPQAQGQVPETLELFNTVQGWADGPEQRAGG